MADKKIGTDYMQNHKVNTVKWVCYVCNVRKRKYASILKLSKKAVDKELYDKFMNCLEMDTNPLLSEDQVKRLFKLAEGIATSTIRPT